MNFLATFLLLTSAFLSTAGVPQTASGASDHSDELKGILITFHVTSVRQEDLNDCDPDKCSSKRYTVEGYADSKHSGRRTSYVLTCVEALQYKPTPHISVPCARVHANTDYDAKLFDDSISFWPEEAYTSSSGFLINYSILSEKEVDKPHQ